MCTINVDLKPILQNFPEFVNYLLKIRSKSQSIDKFILNKEQKYIHKKIEEQKRKIGKVRILILKGRQIGSTTLCSAYNLHNMFTKRGYRSLVLAHRQSATNNIFDIIFRYLSLLPKKIKPKMRFNINKNIAFLHNDSSIIFSTAGSKDVGRSSTINFFHGSEVAFWSNGSNHISSILMAVPDTENSTIILESTSSGANGIFYDMCMDSYNNNSIFQLIFIPWYWHIVYQSKRKISLPKEWINYGKKYNLKKKQLVWAYEQNLVLETSNNVENGPTLRFLQEFPGSVKEAFLSSEDNMLISSHLAYKNAIDNSSFKKEDIKYQFTQDMKYKIRILGVDVATTGSDKTCIIDKVGNFLGFNINEQYKNVSTMEICGILINHIKNFNPDKIYIDAMGGGIGIYDRLVELGYKEKIDLIYFSQKPSNNIRYLNKRAEMWDRLRIFLEEEKTYIIKDEKLLTQISSVKYFFNSNGQIQLEAKENIKKRLKASCDMADAAVLTFADMIKEISNNSFISYEQNKNNIYDPFTW